MRRAKHTVRQFAEQKMVHLRRQESHACQVPGAMQYDFCVTKIKQTKVCRTLSLRDKRLGGSGGSTVEPPRLLDPRQILGLYRRSHGAALKALYSIERLFATPLSRAPYSSDMRLLSHTPYLYAYLRLEHLISLALHGEESNAYRALQRNRFNTNRSRPS